MEKNFVEFGYVVSLMVADGASQCVTVRDARTGHLIYVGDTLNDGWNFLVHHADAFAERVAADVKVIDNQ